MVKLFYRILGIFICLTFILGAIFYSSNDISFYLEQYEENNTTQYTGMSLEDLEKTTVVLIDYLNDFSKEKTLDLQVVEFGEEVNVFDNRETMHMIDVRDLYQNFLILNIALFVLSILGSAFLFYLDKKNFIRRLFKGYEFSLAFTFITIALLGFIFTINFNWFWTNFHHVFFTNDLWLLDASISTMINMFPLEFFYSICFSIVAKIIILCLSFYFILFVGKKTSIKRNKK